MGPPARCLGGVRSPTAFWNLKVKKPDFLRWYYRSAPICHFLGFSLQQERKQGAGHIRWCLGILFPNTPEKEIINSWIFSTETKCDRFINITF